MTYILLRNQHLYCQYCIIQKVELETHTQRYLKVSGKEGVFHHLMDGKWNELIQYVLLVLPYHKIELDQLSSNVL